MTAPRTESRAAEDEARFCCTACRAIYRAGFDRCPRDGARLEPLADDPLVGCVLQDRYLIECCIGEGAMGRVYRARHTRMTKRFAIKVLFGDLAADPRMRARFAQEAEAASRMDHPNVVSVVDFGGNEHGLVYLAMDYIEGQNLATLMAIGGAFDQDRVIRMGRELAKGLGHAHGRGLIHRDFKAENVVVVAEAEREIPKIIDFGVAFLKERQIGDERLTTQGCVVGTPAYMSPEQAAGLELDHRTDLFSLGLLMYEMLAGKPPFDGSPIELARKNATVPIPAIGARAPHVHIDSRVEAAVMKLLSKKRDDRFASADDVVSALNRIRPDSTVIPGSRPRRSSSGPDQHLPVPMRSVTPGQGIAFAPSRLERPGGSSTEMEPISIPGRSARAKLYLVFVLLFVCAGVALVVRGELKRRAADATAVEALDVPEDPKLSPPPRPPERQRERSAERAPIRVVESPDPTPAPAAAAPIRRKPIPLPDKAPPAEVSLQLFNERYLAVVSAIDRLQAAEGDAVATPFRVRLKEIPYQDAINIAELRRETLRDLDRLAAEIRAAEQR